MKPFVFIEQFNGQVIPASLEALGAAKTLGQPVTAVLLGAGVAALASTLAEHGADAVVVADHAALKDVRAEAYVGVLAAIAREHQPSVFFAASTVAGRDIFAALAVDLNTGCIADAIAIQASGDTVSVTKPVYAGKLLADVVCARTPALVCLRPRAFPKPEPTAGAAAPVTTVAAAVDEAAQNVTVKEYLIEQGQVSLTEAKIIVSGGRGVGGPEGFAPVRDLAVTLGGAMGASRAAVDAGWIPYAHQVGQTGKTVAPDLYIAAGISGSIQHQAGMRNAKLIVAVNKDADAPIFKLARYGVVADLFKILPALNAEFKKRLGK